MRTINGEKFISEKEFQSAVSESLISMMKIIDEQCDKGDPMLKILLPMILTSEFVHLEIQLFGDEKKKDK